MFSFGSLKGLGFSQVLVKDPPYQFGYGNTQGFGFLLKLFPHSDWKIYLEAFHTSYIHYPKETIKQFTQTIHTNIKKAFTDFTVKALSYKVF